MAVEPAPLPQFLTIDEVAEQLRTTRKAIYALIYKGALPGVIRLSRRLLVDRADLVKWLSEKRAASRIPQGDPR
jgi:excisionase family DNA binding protein